MKTPFQKELDSLDLTYAQVELIMQAVEKHIFGKNFDNMSDIEFIDWENKGIRVPENPAPTQAGDRYKIRKAILSYYQESQRIALRGEPE